MIGIRRATRRASRYRRPCDRARRRRSPSEVVLGFCSNALWWDIASCLRSISHLHGKCTQNINCQEKTRRKGRIYVKMDPASALPSLVGARLLRYFSRAAQHENSKFGGALPRVVTGGIAACDPISTELIFEKRVHPAQVSNAGRCMLAAPHGLWGMSHRRPSYRAIEGRTW